MASSLLASTQSSPVPADLLSSSYVIHCSTTWCLHTGSTFRSLFPPTFLVYCHIMQDSVFVRLFFLNYRQSTAMQTNDGFVSILLYVKKVFLLWKIIWSSWNSVLFSTSFTLFLAVLALNKLLTLKNNVAIHILCSPPSPQDLPLQCTPGCYLGITLVFHCLQTLTLSDETLPFQVPFICSPFHQLQLIFLAAGSIFGIFQHLLLSAHNSYLTLDMISHTGQS